MTLQDLSYSNLGFRKFIAVWTSHGNFIDGMFRVINIAVEQGHRLALSERDSLIHPGVTAPTAAFITLTTPNIVMVAHTKPADPLPPSVSPRTAVDPIIDDKAAISIKPFPTFHAKGTMESRGPVELAFITLELVARTKLTLWQAGLDGIANFVNLYRLNHVFSLIRNITSWVKDIEIVGVAYYKYGMFLWGEIMSLIPASDAERGSRVAQPQPMANVLNYIIWGVIRESNRQIVWLNLFYQKKRREVILLANSKSSPRDEHYLASSCL